MRWRRKAKARSEDATEEGELRALVYRGTGRSDRLCAEAVADVLQRSRWRFSVDFVGGGADKPLTEAELACADIYVQPGGGTLRPAYRRLRRNREMIRDYVFGGGRFLGICLGGYLAGATPGFGLLPGDADRYIDVRESVVDHDGEAVVPLFWRGQYREAYIQDPPHFVLEEDHQAIVLARYTNGAIAAVVTPFGRGTVGVVGFHPEAPDHWLDGLCEDPTTAANGDLAWDLVDTVMRDPFRQRSAALSGSGSSGR